jgi:hypothetical protein
MYIYKYELPIGPCVSAGEPGLPEDGAAHAVDAVELAVLRHDHHHLTQPEPVRGLGPARLAGQPKEEREKGLYSRRASTKIRTFPHFHSVAVPGCLSRILIFVHPGSLIPDPKNSNKREG